MSASQHERALERAVYPEQHPAFDQFVATISALRAPDGCPWDREQTHSSIAHNMIEEAYEAVDAIERWVTFPICARSWAMSCCRWCCKVR